MTDISELPGISQQEIDRLRAAHMFTIDELRDYLATTPADDIKRFAGQIDIRPSRLIELVGSPGVDRIAGINAQEVERLHRDHIWTIDRLWGRVGADFESGVAQLARTIGMPEDRLIALLAAPVRQRPGVLTSDIRIVGGLRPYEAARLRHAHINTVEELWERAGASDDGIVNISTQADITQDRLIDLLANQGLSEIDRVDRSLVRRYQFVGLLLLALLLLAGLWLNALSARSGAVFAARDLEPGQVLQSDAVYTGTLPLSEDYITSTTELTGSIMTQAVQRGKPLRFTDVLRPQVVAASDILSGTIIASDAISMTWSVYQPGAATRPDQVADKIARYPIRRGTVVPAGFVGPVPRLRQVVINAPAGLPAFHVIGPGDVISKEVPLESDTFTMPADAEGRYTLRALPPGATLHADQLSTVKLPQSDLAGRVVVSMPAEADALGPIVVPGAHLSMLLVPRADAKGVAPDESNDVIVLYAARRGASADIVVAMIQEDFQKAKPLLGVSNAVFFKAVPAQ